MGNKRGMKRLARKYLTKLLNREGSPTLAEHILATGSPEYRERFNAYFAGGDCPSGHGGRSRTEWPFRSILIRLWSGSELIFAI